jgi:hypothetical protein
LSLNALVVSTIAGTIATDRPAVAGACVLFMSRCRMPGGSGRLRCMLWYLEVLARRARRHPDPFERARDDVERTVATRANEKRSYSPGCLLWASSALEHENIHSGVTRRTRLCAPRAP